MSNDLVKNEIPLDILRGFLEADERGALITIKVKPHSSKERLFLSSTNEIALSVRAQALENAANVRVIEVLSQIFSLPKSKIEIVSGHKSRIKRFLLREI